MTKFHNKEYPIALLQGMKLISVRKIYKRKYTDHEGFVELFFTIFGIPLTGLALLFFVSSGLHWAWTFAVVGIFILMYYFTSHELQFDHYEYDVIINTNISIYEFYYNYNLVKIDGDVWTIVTKEENEIKHMYQVCDYILNKKD